jgi:hypothetical protein
MNLKRKKANLIDNLLINLKLLIFIQFKIIHLLVTSEIK